MSSQLTSLERKWVIFLVRSTKWFLLLPRPLQRRLAPLAEWCAREALNRLVTAAGRAR